MSFSNDLEALILDHLFGLAEWTQPTELWVGLSTADPGEDGSTLAEPEDAAYARVQCDPGAAQWTRTDSTVDNDAAITFPQATESWGAITHAAIFDAEDGTFLVGVELTSPVTVGTGSTARFNAGDLNVTCD